MYDFKIVEESVLTNWKNKKILEKLRKRNVNGKKFYFLQGPPYTSGRLHIGHAWNNCLKDIVLRYKRMNGFNVWDRGGYDMHGLPTENAVQKKLGIKDKLGIEKYGVEKFINECNKFSSDNARLMDKDLERLGVWFDHENAYWPIKNEFIEGEWWFIKRAWEEKRLYKGKKIMHWCASCETSLAKHELEYENLSDESIFLKFPTDDGRFLIIWTTTPWTIPFNLAVMVNPDVEYVEIDMHPENETTIPKTSRRDRHRGEKWIIAKELVKPFMKLLKKTESDYKVLHTFNGKTLKGLSYRHPLENEIPMFKELKKKFPKVHTIVLSKEYVNTENGSGLVHCAPGCGPEDYEVGKENGIEAFNNLNEKGVFENMGEFDGLRAKLDDDKFIDILKRSGSLITTTNVEHEYATCWRCHEPVVFRATEQWFLKIEDLINKMLKFNEYVNWQPPYTSKNYNNWIENLKDNGVTRQRYWGCPMPIWECDKCKNLEVVGSTADLKKLKANNIPKDLHKPWIDDVKLKCSKCKSEMKRVPDVIDVWIDSGTASWNCLYNNPKLIKEWFPADFILEATEQIRLWFSMLQMCSSVALGKSAYKNVYCHGMILDFKGLKMSKSLGNIISPYEVVDKYGADVLRYYMCGNPSGENINFTWEDVKIKQRNLNILDNISRFILDLRKQTKPSNKFDLEEKWILSRLNSIIKNVTSLMNSYRIDEIVKEIEDLYLDLSRVYIKLVRDKVNTKDAGKVLYAVEEVYEKILKMFSIVCPFISDDLFKKTFGKESVHLESWPKADEKQINKKLEEEMKIVLEVIEKGLAERDKFQISLKWPLSKAVVSGNFKLNDDLKWIIERQLNVKKIELKDGKNIDVKIDTKQTPELEAEGYSRELIRQIQAFRKKLGLEKKDVINLIIVCDAELNNILENQKNSVAERTNAKKIEFVTTLKETFKNKADFKIKDKRGAIIVIK